MQGTDEKGIVVLEAAAAISFFLLLLYPLIGIIELFITQNKLESIAASAVNESGLTAFRLFSGDASWYTRPIDGADEQNFINSNNPALVKQTALYHQRFDRMAENAEQKLRSILGADCKDLGCAKRFGVEVRIVIPYIQHESKKLIRITCASAGAACPHGRATDLQQAIAKHRFLRSRGSLLVGQADFRDRVIRLAKSPDILSAYAIPSGLFQVRHYQNYGSHDYAQQHGFVPTNGSEIAPDYVRHIMLLAARVAVDLEGSPAGFVLKLARRWKAKNEAANAILQREFFTVPRVDF